MNRIKRHETSCSCSVVSAMYSTVARLLIMPIYHLVKNLSIKTCCILRCFNSPCTSKSPSFVGTVCLLGLRKFTFLGYVCINKRKKKSGFEADINMGLRHCKVNHSHNNIQTLNRYFPQFVLLSSSFDSRLFTT